MKTFLTVMCVYCKKKREMDENEAHLHAKEGTVPMCECGGVMVAHSATSKP